MTYMAIYDLICLQKLKRINAMHDQLFLHNLISKSLSFIHKARLKILLGTVFSLINNGRLTLSSLGQNLTGTAKVKNKIKAVDRLLGNKLLRKDSFYIYQALSKKLLNNAHEATILLDYSGCCTKEHWIIRASIIGEGRSIIVYQETHSLEVYDSSKIKKSFLIKLKKIIPNNIKVTLVTDAAFRTPWFKLVKSFGWEFLGRARGKVKIKLLKEGWWKQVKSLFKHATSIPKFLGEAAMSINHQFPVYLYTYKGKLYGRKVTRKKNRHLYPGKQEQYSKLNREPWIIVSSQNLKPKKAIALYKKRMQIEQNFRDDKNERWGFAWRFSRTKNYERYSILLLIAYIASLVLWLIGRAAEAKNLHKDFQANTSKKRTLSYLTLGKQVLKHAIDKIRQEDILAAIDDVAYLQTTY